MKVYTCRDCGDMGYGPCVLIVDDESTPPESCPYPNPGTAEWLLRVNE
jgi:hypothetical protein